MVSLRKTLHTGQPWKVVPKLWSLEEKKSVADGLQYLLGATVARWIMAVQFYIIYIHVTLFISSI